MILFLNSLTFCIVTVFYHEITSFRYVSPQLPVTISYSSIKSNDFMTGNQSFTVPVHRVERENKNDDKALMLKRDRINKTKKINDKEKQPVLIEGVRLNKCLMGLSRRAADEAISVGRVTIDREIVTQAGTRVCRGSVVRLDGKTQQWSAWNDAKRSAPAKVLEDRQFVYLKYWK